MRALFLLVALLGAPGAIVAQRAAAPATAAAPDSPRASLERYLDLTRDGRFEDAAAYLELSPERAAQGPVLARRLKSVLDHYLWFDRRATRPTAWARASSRSA